MNGFKDGASSDDPFSDTEDEDSESETGNEESETGNEDTENRASVASDDRNTDTGIQQNSGLIGTDDPAESVETSRTSASSSLPWIYQRTSITDGREKTVQLHLRSATLDEQRQGLAEVEGILGESVKKADLREAAFLVGLAHLDEVTATLRKWGYDFE